MKENSYSLQELASHINARLVGDPNCTIVGIAPLANAAAQQISFLTVDALSGGHHHDQYLPGTKASAVILKEEMLKDCPVNALVTDDPYLAFAKLAQLFAPKKTVSPGVHATAIVGAECSLSPSASIGPHCVLGDRVTIGANTVLAAGCYVGDDGCIGDDCYLYPRVTCYHNVQLGNRIILHSGVVVGADGFSYANSEQKWHKIPQLGGVLLADDVEVGANTTIDRGVLENTVIAEGVKLDNQIQIGHNVHVGAHTAIAGCTGVAGSTHIGRFCKIGGGAGIGGHLQIVDQVVIAGRAMVTKSLTAPGFYASGTGVLPGSQWRRCAVLFRQLDKIVKRIKRLEEASHD